MVKRVRGFVGETSMLTYVVSGKCYDSSRSNAGPTFIPVPLLKVELLRNLSVKHLSLAFGEFIIYLCI